MIYIIRLWDYLGRRPNIVNNITIFHLPNDFLCHLFWGTCLKEHETRRGVWQWRMDHLDKPHIEVLCPLITGPPKGWSKTKAGGFVWCDHVLSKTLIFTVLYANFWWTFTPPLGAALLIFGERISTDKLQSINHKPLQHSNKTDPWPTLAHQKILGHPAIVSWVLLSWLRRRSRRPATSMISSSPCWATPGTPSRHTHAAKAKQTDPWSRSNVPNRKKMDGDLKPLSTCFSKLPWGSNDLNWFILLTRTQYTVTMSIHNIKMNSKQ